MKSFEDYFNLNLITENAASRQYSCLMLDCSDFKDELEKIQDEIDEEDLYTEEEGHGLETEPHITILYGIHEQNPKIVKDELELPFGPCEYTLEKLSLFENEKYDVLKCTVKSSDLKRYNKLCIDKLEYTNSYPDYIPHLTVAYLKPGTGKKYVSIKSDKFGENLMSSEYIFSNKNSKKTKWTDNKID